MDQESRKPLRIVLWTAAFSVAVSAMFLFFSASTEVNAAQQSPIFMGGNPEGLGTLEDIDVRTSRLRFPAGVRSNWHTHVGGGQLLMIESGRGLHQVRGGPLHEMRPNEPWYTAEGVEHWHGAHPDEAAVQWTIYGGDVNWLEPVQDEQYRMRAQRP
jgi:quercetin dioxygenase-like cupin family protein